MNKKLPWVILGAGTLLRAPGLFRPLLGNFAVYQTAQAMMADFFIRENFASLLMPRVYVMASGEPGLMLLYYPVASFIAAVLSAFSGIPVEFWGRAQALFFFVLAAAYLYRWIREWFGNSAAIAALAVFNLLPLTVIYAQSFQNEMATVFFSVFFFYYLHRAYSGAGFPALVLSALGLSGILLTRPNCLYVVLPALFLAFDQKYSGVRMKRIRDLILISAAAAVIPALWYLHCWNVTQQNSNIYSTLFAQVAVRSSFISPMVFQLEYYKKLFDMLAGVALTPIGLTLFVLGIFIAASEGVRGRFFILWAAAALGSSMLIPRKLIDHDFYLLHFILPGCVLIGAGALRILAAFPAKSKKKLIGYLVLLGFLVSARYSLHPAFVTPAVELNIPRIGALIQTMTEPDERIVVQGTHSLLYYAKRYGWALTVSKPKGEISDYLKSVNWEKLPPAVWEQKKKAFETPQTALEFLRSADGARYLVITNLEEFYAAGDFSNFVNTAYQLIHQEKGVCLIYKLV